MSTPNLANTILDEWRDEERENLFAVYDALEAIIRHPEGPVSRESIDSLRELLKIENRHITAGDERRTFVVDLADHKLETGNETARYEARITQLQQWRDELAAKARWDRISDVDAHIIHLHMARLHSDRFADLMKKANDARGLIPYAIDTLESDELSIYLLSTRCEDIDSTLATGKGTDIEGRKAIVEAAIETVAESGPHWGHLPGMRRRGISISTGMKTDELTIEGNTVTISTKAFPESVQMKDFNGKPLHEVIDLGGYRNDKLKIIRTMRIDNRNEIAFNIDRNAKHMRVRVAINPEKYR